MASQSIDKLAGCLLGGALGDAMGVPHEGKATVATVAFEGERALEI